MHRVLEALGMAGVAMNTTVLGRALVEPDYEPIFAELNRRGAVLYLHPAGNNACSPLIGNYHLTWMVDAPVEDTISVMHPEHQDHQLAPRRSAADVAAPSRRPKGPETS